MLMFSMVFFSFFQLFSKYLMLKMPLTENQFPQVKHNKNAFRFPHFLKNIKNAYKNHFPQVKLNKKSCRFLHFLKNKICDIL